MACDTIYVGDTFRVGPYYARRPDGTVLPLTGALIESACKLATGGAEVFRMENAAAGGSDQEIEVTDLVTGEFWVYVDTASSALLTAAREYKMDARVKTAESPPEVAVVGYVIFRAEAPITPVPA